jgi:hypothetical protein
MTVRGAGRFTVRLRQPAQRAEPLRLSPYWIANEQAFVHAWIDQTVYGMTVYRLLSATTSQTWLRFLSRRPPSDGGWGATKRVSGVGASGEGMAFLPRSWREVILTQSQRLARWGRLGVPLSSSRPAALW